MAECQWISPEEASPKSLHKPLGTSWALQGWGAFIFNFHFKHLRELNEVEQVYELLASFFFFLTFPTFFVDWAAVYFISKWGIRRLELVNLACICLTLYFIYLVIVNMSHPAAALSLNNPSLSHSSAPLLLVFGGFIQCISSNKSNYMLFVYCTN